MKNKNLIKIIFITLATLFSSLYLNGQTINQLLISPGGETIRNQYFQLDWSIGELSTSTFTNSQVKLTEGFHQTDIKITEVKTPSMDQFKIEVYPNPATSYIVVKADAIDTEKLRSIISDTNGKVIMKPTITSTSQEIDISPLASGIYYLRILYEDNTIKTFKIVKTTNK